jgi:hypothetical protein
MITFAHQLGRLPDFTNVNNIPNIFLKEWSHDFLLSSLLGVFYLAWGLTEFTNTSLTLTDTFNWIHVQRGIFTWHSLDLLWYSTDRWTH